MDTEKQRLCVTKLLDDIPAGSDEFTSGNEIGPHQRVADAIASMILSAEVGGKAIGLEGGWGSGKSTVVRFLADRFSASEDYTVVLFDAWAHEGDPLRRTFIESVVHELCNYGWASEAAWQKKLEELANRRKETTTKITPKPTGLGKAMAISLLLVPVGTALIAGGFRDGVTVGLGLPPNWFFCLGLNVTLSPFWVLAYRWVQLRTRVKCVSPVLIAVGTLFLGDGIHQAVTGSWALWPNWLFGALLSIGPVIHWLSCWWKVSKEDSNPQKHSSFEHEGDDEDNSDWAFLFSRAVNQTHTETTETPNPTSLEFDDHFGELMAESLADESRRLLLVLDNLDRVDAETALSIWGTLQTFLHDRNHDADPWYRRLWVVVPYDPIRIRKLWNQPEEHGLVGEGENGQSSTETIRTTESFLDKSFQVRFHVTPPAIPGGSGFLLVSVPNRWWRGCGRDDPPGGDGFRAFAAGAFLPPSLGTTDFRAIRAASQV